MTVPVFYLINKDFLAHLNTCIILIINESKKIQINQALRKKVNGNAEEGTLEIQLQKKHGFL